MRSGPANSPCAVSGEVVSNRHYLSKALQDACAKRGLNLLIEPGSRMLSVDGQIKCRRPGSGPGAGCRP